MKRLSIKARVTVWYTVFMLVLVCAALSALFLMSGNLSAQRLRTQLIGTVSDTVSDAHFRLGKLETDRLDFYRDGVSLFIYDTNGYLLAPKINLGIQVDSLLQDQTLRTISAAGGRRQMVYDLYAVQDGTAFWVRGILSMDEAGLAYRTLLMLLLGTFPLFVFLIGLGGYRITQSAFRPIAVMADTADQISSGQDLSRRVGVEETGDELSHLGRTLNSMLARLQDSFEHERQFTSDVSHELRTPLSVIQSQCEYALSPAADDTARRDALAAVFRQSRRMNEMVSQLLMLSRADRGVFQLEKSCIDLSRLAADCCEDLAPAVEAAGLCLSSEIAPGIKISGDETLLHRLIINLLTNAVRYNKAGGRIELCLKADPSETVPARFAVLTVADTGIGISPEALPKIWDRFYREDTSRSSEGTGLGLAMVKWIAEVHGGAVSAESEVGRGSRFTVRFPIN